MTSTRKMCDCNQGRLPCTCKPDQQHQGEPVALPERVDPDYFDSVRQTGIGWNACLDEIAKLGPLYSQADPNVRWEAVAGEQMKVIEGLRDSINTLAQLDNETITALRAQLADAHVQLGEFKQAILAASKSLFRYRELNDEMYALWELVRRFLSASVEPSAPTKSLRQEMAELDGDSENPYWPASSAEELAEFEAWRKARAALERKP